MKIKGIADVCKEREGAAILEKYDEQGELQRQFIMTRNRQAVYPIDGMPRIDENTILTVFDIPKEKRSNWNVCRDMLEGNYLKRVLADYDESDRAVNLEGITIAHKGNALVPFLTQYGAVFIRADYLKPIKDEGKSLEFWAREITPGSPPDTDCQGGHAVGGGHSVDCGNRPRLYRRFGRAGLCVQTRH